MYGVGKDVTNLLPRSFVDETFRGFSESRIREMIKLEWEEFKEDKYDPYKAASQIIYELNDWTNNNSEKKRIVIEQVFKLLLETYYEDEIHHKSKELLMEKLAVSLGFA
jgi:hypothetical protein